MDLRPIPICELEKMKVDIKGGDLFSKEANLEENKDCRDFYCQAVYHYGQAFEKGIKALIWNHLDIVCKGWSWKEKSDFKSILKSTHDFDILLEKAQCLYDFKTAYPFIDKNSLILCKLNGMRYGRLSVSKEGIADMRKETKAFYRWLEQAVLEKYPDPNERKEMLKLEWEQRDGLNLKPLHKSKSRDKGQDKE